MKRATIKDIALQVGVSVSTVSRALSDHPDISANIKAEVRRVAEELRYHPNRLAANLRQSRSKLIGLIVPEITMFFVPSVIKGVEEVLRAEGYQLLVMQSHESLEEEKRNLLLCSDYQIDGLLISLSSESLGLEHLDDLSELGIPVVLFDKSRPQAPFDQIQIDDRQAAYDCVRYLINKGARTICGLFGHRDLAISQNRLRGFQDALRDAGLDPATQPLVFAASQVEGRAAAAAQLKQGVPDAFFYMSDELASGLMPALTEAGVRVPADCLVLGMSDGKLPYLHYPALSHYLHSGADVGRAAARRLLYRIKENLGRTDVVTQVLRGEIIPLGTA